MAHVRLQRQAELDIVLEYGSELGAISDGSPVVRDEYRFRGVQGHHCLDLSGVKSLDQRRDNAFGFSWEWKALGLQGPPVFYWALFGKICECRVVDRSAGRIFPIAGAYSFHSGRELCRDGPGVPSYDITSRVSGNNNRLSTLWREVISLAGGARSLFKHRRSETFSAE